MLFIFCICFQVSQWNFVGLRQSKRTHTSASNTASTGSHIALCSSASPFGSEALIMHGLGPPLPQHHVWSAKPNLFPKHTLKALCVTLIKVIMVRFSVAHLQRSHETACQCLPRIKHSLSAVQRPLRHVVGLITIQSPLQSKWLISHSAGLWLLTRTNFASCWLATQTGTAMIGCLAPGGYTFDCVLCIYSPCSFWWHILALILVAPCHAEETGGGILAVVWSVCLCVSL